ncbi:MAG: type II toxin-antitoxin system MqsA family antitoxin [Bradymonadia bacterium]
MTRPRTCPACGVVGMIREARPDAVEYAHNDKIHTRNIMQPAWWCDTCGEAVLEGEDIAYSEDVWKSLKADVHGVLSPTQVKAIREGLGISQRRAGLLLGGGEKAFAKYERGSVLPSQAMSGLLLLLEGHPERLRELEGLRTNQHSAAD